MWAIIKKEIKTYFFSPIGYIFIGTFVLISSISFYYFLWIYKSVQYSELFSATTEILTFTIALLTMGMFAAERKNGTEMLLLTSSRSITSIVLGKILAALFVIVITEIISLIYYGILCYFAGEMVTIEKTITVLVGFLLVTMSYISFGAFISSLTENQIIAGIITIGALLGVMIVSNFVNAFEILSPITLFVKFKDGIIPITDTVCLISQTLMFTLLTITVLQRRKNLK